MPFLIFIQVKKIYKQYMVQSSIQKLVKNYLQIIQKFMETKKLKWLQQYRTAIAPEKKQRKQIKTYGTYRPSQIQSLQKLNIKEDVLKTLIIDTLKLCYLYGPLEMALIQQKETRGGLLKVSQVIKVFVEGLFYRHMIPPKIKNYISQGCLVNNRSTQMNVKVVISAMFAYVSKRLSLQDIAACMLIFNLEEALYGLRPFGLPLDQIIIVKTFKKVERTINNGDLRNIFIQIKDEKQTSYITPDQFLYLASITMKKSRTNSIFFIQNIKEDILCQENQSESTTKKFQQEEISKTKTATGIIQGLSFFEEKESIKNKENVYKEIKKTLFSKKKTKSMMLIKQMEKKPRTHSSLFKKAVQMVRDKSKTVFCQSKGKSRIRNASFIRKRNEHENLRKSRISRYNLIGYLDRKKMI